VRRKSGSGVKVDLNRLLDRASKNEREQEDREPKEAHDDTAPPGQTIHRRIVSIHPIVKGFSVYSGAEGLNKIPYLQPGFFWDFDQNTGDLVTIVFSTAVWDT